MLSKISENKPIFTKLDTKIITLLCCPLCKGNLHFSTNFFQCKDCNTKFERKQLLQKKHKEFVFDFCIHKPDYCVPLEKITWDAIQGEYINLHLQIKKKDLLSDYTDAIDSVTEIYNREFTIKGSVLDIGGGKGTLRHFLDSKTVPFYISIDPYLEIFQNLEKQPNLLKAYPCLYAPCNFLLSHAENLPFKKNSFDWVHMRSVLDHFFDPYLAIKEAYRVLKPEGTILIGLSVEKKITKPNIKQKNNKKILQIIRKLLTQRLKIVDDNPKIIDHTFHWDYENVLDLLSKTGFKIVKKHWQKPPFTQCVYISAQKK